MTVPDSADERFVKPGSVNHARTSPACEGIRKAGQVCVCVAALLSAGPSLLAQAQDAKPPAKPNPSAVEAAVATLGGVDLRSIKYSGTGVIHTSGQRLLSPSPGDRIVLKSYDVSIDYPASSMSIEVVRDTGANGELAAAGENRQIHAVNGATAWDVSFVPASLDSPITKTAVTRRSKSGNAAAAVVAQPPEGNPGAAVERRYAIWVTPHGFLKAALANQPALRPAGSGTEVSFYSGGQRFVGFVNSKNQVERVRTWIKQPSGDDLLIDTTYTDYATFGKVSFPTRIVQAQTGQPTLELSITSVQPNVPVRVPIPETLAVAR
jgi:hypothetical protein